MPRPLLKFLRVPEDVPPGPLATTRLDEELIRRGLIIAKVPEAEGEEEEDDRWWEEKPRPPTLADKLRLLFDALYPEVDDVLVNRSGAPASCCASAATSTSTFSRAIW